MGSDLRANGQRAGSAPWGARLSSAGQSRVASEWLALRERADAEARAAGLVEVLREHLAGAERLVIRDLGCGTGAQPRWLAGRLPGPQHWILHDLDADLLGRAAASVAGTATGAAVGGAGPVAGVGAGDAAAGGALTVEARWGDLTALRADDLAGTSLVTGSAVLDLLTLDEVDALAEACVDAGCPALLTLSVVGEVEFSPDDPLDATFGTAFNDHQRREVDGRRLLGPDAVTATAEAFARRGARVRRGPSPWRLGADQAALVEEWLRGWVEAACAQQPDLDPTAEAYLHRRLDACASGNLRVVVHHADLLALPPP